MLLCTSCSVNYMPTPSASPMINKKGETVVMGNFDFSLGNYDFSSQVVGKSFTAASSPIKNIVLGYNHFNHYKQNGLIFNTNYDELFFGVYKNINENYFYDIYLSYGKGKNHSEIDTSNSIWSNKEYANIYYRYETFSINPSFSYKSEKFEYSFGIKVSQLSIYDLYIRDMRGSSFYTRYDKFDDQKYIFIQPSVKVKYGLKNLKLCTQVTLNRNLSENIINYNGLTVSAGIQFQFNFLKL